MAENIIIVPSASTITFEDSGSTKTVLSQSSNELRWGRGGTTYLTWSAGPTAFSVANADLKVTTSLGNNALSPLINSTGWLGNPEPQGAQGASGSTGSQGAKGFSGDTGAQGAVGPQGLSGATGAQGSIGAQGATGGQGSHGNTGAQGSQGGQGAQGPVGAQGNTGSQGAQG